MVDVTVPGVWEGLEVAPVIEATLAAVRDELVGISVGREARLRKGLSGVQHDLVLIDCPPELGLLTINGLAAATGAVMISHAKLFSAQGTAGILDTITTVREHYNPHLCFAGVIINAHEPHTITGRERLEELRAAVPVIEPVIPKRAPDQRRRRGIRGPGPVARSRRPRRHVRPTPVHSHPGAAMSSRPAARKSTLGTTHPAAPPPAEAVGEQAPGPGRAPVTTPTKAPSSRTKVTFYTTAELAGQARAVLANVPPAVHKYRNLSEFIDAAVAGKVTAMQQQHNNGQPWPDAKAGDIATGRPLE